MPSTAFGPLVEPGWPDLKGPDLAARFMAGAALGASVNARAMQLERQMAQMSLAAQKMEYDRQHQADMFGLAQQKLEYDNQAKGERIGYLYDKMQADADYHRQAMDLRDRAQLLDQKEFDLKTRKYDDVLQGRDAFMDAVVNSGQPGTKGYEERFNQNLGDAASKVPTQLINGWRSAVYNNHNYTANKTLQDYAAKEKSFRNAVSDTVWGTLDSDLSPILHPEDLKKEPPQISGGHWWSGYERKDTGRVLVTNATGTVKDRPVRLQDLMNLKKQYDQLQQEREKLPSLVNKPELGVWAPGQGSQVPPIPLPANKADLRLDQPYISNKGTMRWTGDKFIPW